MSAKPIKLMVVGSNELTPKEARAIALFRQLNDECQSTYLSCFEDNLKSPNLRRATPRTPATPVIGTNVFALRGGAQ